MLSRLPATAAPATRWRRALRRILGWMSAPPNSPRVAIVTGASRGIGAAVVAAFRTAGYAVVATARSMPGSDEHDLLTVSGDIAEAATAQRVVELALDRFGRIDTLINNAGIFIGKPFTEYSPDDYAAMTAVNLAGFFPHHAARDTTDARTGRRPHRQRHDQPRLPRQERQARCSGLIDQGRARCGHPLASPSSTPRAALRVNAVSLGVIRTQDGCRPCFLPEPGSHAPLGQDRRDQRRRRQRILYLERATFVTGETLHIDGGQAAGQ